MLLQAGHANHTDNIALHAAIQELRMTTTMTRLNARTWALDTAFNESLTIIIKMWQAQPSAAGASMLCHSHWLHSM
jgi:hypothetical protein